MEGKKKLLYVRRRQMKSFSCGKSQENHLIDSSGPTGQKKKKKKLVCKCRRLKGHGFDPWVRKIPWRRLWQPTPVFLPGQSHGQGAWRATVHRVAQSLKQLSTAQHMQSQCPRLEIFQHCMPGGYKLLNHNFKKENKKESFKILLQLKTYLIFNGIMYQIYFLLSLFCICVCVYIYIKIEHCF